MEPEPIGGAYGPLPGVETPTGDGPIANDLIPLIELWQDLDAPLRAIRNHQPAQYKKLTVLMDQCLQAEAKKIISLYELTR